MPYVPMAPAGHPSLAGLADARWAAIRSARPELAPAVALQQQIVNQTVSLMDAVQVGGVPRLSLPPRYIAAKLGRGVPALTGEPIPIPSVLLTPAFLQFADDLARGGAGAAAEHIRDAVAEGRIDAGSLLVASLTRDQSAIRTGAVHLGLAPDLLWLVAELAVSPFAFLLQQRLLDPGADPTLAEALDAWPCGYCPSCGSWPALAESPDGRRVLRCSFCAAAWTPPVVRCAYCGGRDLDIAPSEGDDARRLETCGTCKAYLKVVAVDRLSPFPLLAIADLETMDLDMTAMSRGFNRPGLKDHRTPGDRPGVTRR